MYKDLTHIIGVGAPRCGTTWLDAVLRRHDQVLAPISEKELNYFKQNNWSEKKYLKRYPKFNDTHKVIIEISPGYLVEFEYLLKIKNSLPDAKIIICVRAPLERLASMVFLYSMYGYKINDLYNKLECDKWFVKHRFLRESVDSCINLFGRGNVLVIENDDMRNNTLIVLRDVYDFMGIYDNGVPNIKKGESNKSSMPRFEKFNRLGSRLNALLRENGLHYMSDFLKKSEFVRDILFSKRKYQSMKKNVLKSCLCIYKKYEVEYNAELSYFRLLLQKDLYRWEIDFNKYDND